MELLELMKYRRSIRKYEDRQIEKDDLNKIIEAGLFAPNAGGGQCCLMVAVRHKDTVEKIGRLNVACMDRSRLVGSYVSKDQPSIIDDPTIKSGFYGAPTVCVLFGPKNFYTTSGRFLLRGKHGAGSHEPGYFLLHHRPGRGDLRQFRGRCVPEAMEHPRNLYCPLLRAAGLLQRRLPRREAPEAQPPPDRGGMKQIVPIKEKRTPQTIGVLFCSWFFMLPHHFLIVPTPDFHSFDNGGIESPSSLRDYSTRGGTSG